MKWLLALPMFAPLCAAAVDIPVTRLDDPLPDGCGVADCSLREAVLFANGSPGADRILLPASASPYQLTRSGSAEDTGLTGDLDVIGALEIVGQGAMPVVVAQAAMDRILHLQGPGAPTTLRNLHLQGGRSVAQGGAVLAIGAQLVVVDSEFSGNSATGYGGAIAARCPSGILNVAVVAIAGSRFEDNSAPAGGAFYQLGSFVDSCNVSIDDSEFRGNVATTIGGAVAMDSSLVLSQLQVRDSLFDDNRVTGADGTGGAVGIGSSTSGSSIADSIFIDNRAVGTTTARGGAVFNADSIVRSLFLANIARRGGAVAGYDPEIEESTFCDNVALEVGGALYVASTTMRRSMFCRNAAIDNGGAIGFRGLQGGVATIERSTFDANTAASGGAISVDFGGLRVFQSTFASVDAPDAGSVGTVLRYSGPQGAENGNFVQLTGNILRGTCSFANGIATVNLAKHNVNSGGNTCGLLQTGAQFTNNLVYTFLTGIPLDPLANNGGPTLTRSLGSGPNTARGRVPLALCVDPDQRYYFTSDAACDAGAFEDDGEPAPDAIFASGFES